MKRRGRHPSEALTGMFIHAVRLPGFYADGNGLYLRIDSSGAKRWILRTVVQGKRRDMGLGSCSQVSLVDARARARRLRKIAEGGDPFAAREQVCRMRHPEMTRFHTIHLTRINGGDSVARGYRSSPFSRPRFPPVSPAPGVSGTLPFPIE